VAVLAVVAQMMPGWLLNWRLWAALGFAVALIGTGWKSYTFGYDRGSKAVQSHFDAYRSTVLEQALAAQAEQTLKEAAMNAANVKVSQDYESLKAATALAVSALDRDRMRLQAAIAAYRGATGKDSGTGLPPDDSATAGVLAACIDQYAGVVSDFDREADKLRGLQAYVSAVCPGHEK